MQERKSHKWIIFCLKKRVIFEKIRAFKEGVARGKADRLCQDVEKSHQPNKKMEEYIYTLVNHWAVERFVFFLFSFDDWHLIFLRLQKWNWMFKE